MFRKKKDDVIRLVIPETAEETLPTFPESASNLIHPADDVECESAEELAKAKLEFEERRKAAMAHFVETGEGLSGWISVHRRGSLNTVAVSQIRNVFPYEIATDEGTTRTRIAFVSGTVLDVDETIEQVRERIWCSKHPDGAWGELWL